MNRTPNLIKSTVLEDIQSHYPVPSPLMRAVNFIEKTNLFFYYRTYRLTTYVNPRNAVLTGGVLHSGAKLTGVADYLKVALYVKCTFDLLERYRQIHDACVSFRETVQFKYPVYCAVEWEFGNNKISAKLYLWWNVTVKKYGQQTWRVIVCVSKVSWEVFKTGVFSRDLYLLTAGDATIEFYAYTDIAENAAKYCKDFEGNVKLLVEHLKSKESLGNCLLKKLGSSKNIGNFIDDIIKKNPRIFAEMRDQIKGAKEDLRGILERGEINLDQGCDRPSTLPECRFIPYSGQKEIDRFFEKHSIKNKDISLIDLKENDLNMNDIQKNRPLNIINNIKRYADSLVKNLDQPVF